LKVFLGASPGVGKTYAMLSEAHEQRQRGVDVLVGLVETHGRAETVAMLEGLEALPPRVMSYRGLRLDEFDLDGALNRKPALILVDELAHTNAIGSRHEKRWQDVEELLKSGIDVYTAVNIQHLESLNDSVAAITGVQVKETVPDRVIERADEIEVVDIPPEELRQRLREGKVYVPERIDHALEGFFRPSNLHALRELALRRAADRVDAQMRALRDSARNAVVWHTRERILVCVAPSAMASRVVRSAARLGAASHAEVLALWVESDRQEGRSPEQQEHARQGLRLAESLGFTTATLAGHDIAGEILAYARKQNVNLIVLGKPVRARWREVLFGSVVDEVVRRSGEIDVHIVTEPHDLPKSVEPGPKPPALHPKRLLMTVAIMSAAIGVSLGLDRFDVPDANLVMLLLLGIAVVANRFGKVESVVATGVGILAFNYLFVEPRYTFAVSDTQYLLTFGVMLGVGLLISTLTLRLRATADNSAERERRTAALYAFSRELSKGRSKSDLAAAAKRSIESVFEGDVAILEAKDDGLAVLAESASRFEDAGSERGAAEWAYRNGTAAGKGTDTLAGAEALYLPLLGLQGSVGSLAFRPAPSAWPLSSAQRSQLETFTNGLGVALERARLAKESHDARLSAESEKLRNALLASISHDLRTPLTSISGAAGALIAQGGGELAETIYQESVRLNNQVQNLLDMTRIQSGEIELNKEWQVLEELVGSALARSRPALSDHPVSVSIPHDLPLLPLDGELMAKLFSNLFENVAHHTPSGTRLTVTAKVQTEIVRVIVADRGPGIPKGEETAIFERFAQGGARGKGLGLGLAICRAIARLHDARLWVRNGREGGAEFHLEIPLPTSQPEVPRG
jgi:two-component system sensor histidine kinase KdpD